MRALKTAMSMGLAAAVLFGGGRAMACGPLGVNDVSVQVVDPGHAISTTKSLSQINTLAGSHGMRQQGTRVLGMTQIAYTGDFEAKIAGHAEGNGYCLQVGEVKVRMKIDKHTVLLPREYPRGSCQYDVVMRHEMAHVRVNADTVRKYSSIMRNELRKALRAEGFASGYGSPAKDQELLKQRIEARIKIVHEQMNAEMERLHADIDRPDSQYAAGKQCAVW